MYDTLKMGFMVAVAIAAFAGLVTIVGHVFIGYAMQAAMLPSCIALFCLAAAIGLLAALAAPKGERTGAWWSAILWMMYGAMMIGQYTNPSDELRAAMEARAK